ncbi:MAG: hypothetical protein PUC32_04715 [Oscillospiraceae bacterium]|nr:hypothetical protein [Oscillospiraceae bacterium]
MDEKKKAPEQNNQEEDALERVEEEFEEMDDYLEEQGIYIRQ